MIIFVTFFFFLRYNYWIAIIEQLIASKQRGKNLAFFSQL